MTKNKKIRNFLIYIWVAVAIVGSAINLNFGLGWTIGTFFWITMEDYYGTK